MNVVCLFALEGDFRGQLEPLAVLRHLDGAALLLLQDECGVVGHVERG